MRDRAYAAVGLMSGTSMDGVDAAVVRIRPGEGWRTELLSTGRVPYTAALRARLAAACAAGSAREICMLNFEIGELFARAALRALKAAGLPARRIDAIGSHGQTICHLPPGSGRTPSTLQIGEAAVIAERTGIAVVADFRPRDMAAGGQGAPLVPLADFLWFHRPRQTRLALNIGGIANVTVAGPTDRETWAFDTGPGNLPIDAAARWATRGARAFDRGGRLASRGTVDEKALREMLRHPFFARKPPRSTGREMFGSSFADGWIGRWKRRRPEDLVATFTRFSSASISGALKRFVLPRRRPSELIVSGGGALNPVLMAQLAGDIAPVPVVSSGVYGIPVLAKEAMAFALLAVRTLRGEPGNLPAATGARKAVVLGKIVRV